MVRALACHARGYRFDPGLSRHIHIFFRLPHIEPFFRREIKTIRNVVASAAIAASLLLGAGTGINADTNVVNVLGGRQVQRGEFPHLASLVANSAFLDCSTTVTSDYSVLTGAHCMETDAFRRGQIPANSQVKIGHDRNNPEQIVDICSIHTPQPYFMDPGASPHDLLLLGTCQRINVNEFVKPITLTSIVSDYLNLRDDVTLAGFGLAIPYTGTIQNIARTATTTVDARNLYTYYIKSRYYITLGDNYTCVSNASSVTDPVALEGDSGSGVMDLNGNLISVVSFGSGYRANDVFFSCNTDLRGPLLNNWVKDTVSLIDSNPGIRQPNVDYKYTMSGIIPNFWRSEHYRSKDFTGTASSTFSAIGNQSIVFDQLEYQVSKSSTCFDYSVVNSNDFSETVSPSPTGNIYTYTQKPEVNFTYTNTFSTQLSKIIYTDTLNCNPTVFHPLAVSIGTSPNTNVPFLKYANYDYPHYIFERVPVDTGGSVTIPVLKPLEVPENLSIGSSFTYTEDSNVITFTRTGINNLSVSALNYVRNDFYLLNSDKTTFTRIPYLFPDHTYTITYTFYDYRAYLPNLLATQPISQ